MAEYTRAAAYLAARATITPQVGIICGSGLSGLSEAMIDTQVFQYEDIPGFPELTVAGHSGELVFGLLSGVPTMCMRGRFHFYEGHPMSRIVMPVRMMRCLGVKVLIVTTASGGLNANWKVGDVGCITDHFSLPAMVGNNPLMGPNDDTLGPRFAPMSNAYSKRMQEIVVKSARALCLDFVRPNCCHGMTSGPQYESATEGRWLRQIGCDTVSMSSVPEITAAHHCGMKVIGLALVTNKVVMPGEHGPAASHQEVLEMVDKRSYEMRALVARVVQELKSELKSIPALPEIDLSCFEEVEGAADRRLLPKSLGFTIGLAAGAAAVALAVLARRRS